MAISYLFANPIDQTTAKTVGINFFATKVLSKKLGVVSNLQIAYTAKDENGNNSFYVYNVSNAKGYVIVAADDASKPILGYSDEGSFDLAHLPEQLKVWLNIYNKQISASIANKAVATDKIKASWQELLNPPAKKKIEDFGTSPNGTSAVEPLVKVFWNQSPQYNNLCPYDSAGGGKSVTGCVATAMAQVMKYWNYPAKGIGSNSYTPAKHAWEGVQTVNFDSTIYQWDSMPSYIGTATSANQIKAIATLMYSCGVAVNMTYGATGSGAYALGGAKYHSANWALITYFGYNPNIQGLSRSSHSDGEWISLIENELNDGRPVLYAGEDTSTSAGHCFVLDGYDANNYFHFNWGWGGLDNGYFLIDSLNPGTNGIGSGSGRYDNYQSAIIGIMPATTTSNITLYNYLTPADTTVAYDSAITVTTNIRNNGNATFVGDIAAAIYDTASNFVTYLQILSNKSLKNGSHNTNNLTFSTSGLSNLAPGTYYVQMLTRPTGGNWTFVADNGSYHNLATLRVLNNTKGIVLFDSIRAGSRNFIQYDSAKVSFNITNASANTFYGQYTIGLYNLNGTLLQTIGTYNETAGLLSGANYPSPLSFSVNSINVNPGRYVLAVTDSSFSGASSEYTGSGAFLNPIYVNVAPPALVPDKYEPNNTVAQAYKLPLNFINDSAYANTAGSNITASTLKDLYYVTLPAGYNYSIHIQLDNANYSSTDSSYTLDGLFAFSINAGSTWTTDRTNVRTITEAGAKTVYFRIAPSLATFAGQIGTYMLELNIVRTFPLPVVFSVVNIDKMGNSNQIKWQVANETNLASYNVERSYDGKAFSAIGSSKATQVKDYSFEDNTFNSNNKTIYYRIVAVDKTGKETYSNIVSIQFSISNSQFSIYPNPVKEQLNLQLSNAKAQNITIQVIDIKGRVLNTKQTLLNAGTNSLSLPVTNLSNGSYIVVIKGLDGTIGQKQFIKY